MASKNSALRAAGLCMMSASSVGIAINSFGVFYEPVSSALGISVKTVSWSATVTSLIIGFLSPALVRLLQRTRALYVMLAGAVLAFASYPLLAYSTGVVGVYASAILRGLGSCCFFFPVVTLLVGRHFTRGRGFYTGLVMSFSGLMGALLNPVTTALIASRGIRTALLFQGTLMLLLACPGCLLSARGVSFAPDAPAEMSGRTDDGHKVFTPLFFVFAVYSFFMSAFTALATFFPAFSVAEEIGAMTGAAMASAAMISNIVSKLAYGFLSDRLGARRTALIMCTITLTGLTLLFFARTAFLLVLASALFGAIYSIAAVSTSILTRAYFRDEDYARVYPVINMITSVSFAIFIALIGLLADGIMSYRGIFLMTLIMMVLTTLLLPVMEGMHKKEKR